MTTLLTDIQLLLGEKKYLKKQNIYAKAAYQNRNLPSYI
jgi:ribosomal protein L39E